MYIYICLSSSRDNSGSILIIFQRVSLKVLQKLYIAIVRAFLNNFIAKNVKLEVTSFVDSFLIASNSHLLTPQVFVVACSGCLSCFRSNHMTK